MKLILLLCAIIYGLSINANDRFLRLILQDGNTYWVTVQTTDDNTGTIQLTDDNGTSYRYENSKNEFLINNISSLNYRIPRKSWGTQIIVRVYGQKPKILSVPFDAIDTTKPNTLIAQANIVQDDGAEWVVNLAQMNIRLIEPAVLNPQTNSLEKKYKTIVSPIINNSNVDLPVRVKVLIDGTIQLLTT